MLAECKYKSKSMIILGKIRNLHRNGSCVNDSAIALAITTNQSSKLNGQSIKYYIFTGLNILTVGKCHSSPANTPSRHLLNVNFKMHPCMH